MEAFKAAVIEGVALAALCGLLVVGLAASWPFWSLIFIALFAIAVAYGLASRVRKCVRERRRGWRLRSASGVMLYEELRSGDWQAIEIDFESHHSTAWWDVIHFRDPPAWAAYPEWARERRDVIIRRAKSEWPRFFFEPESSPRP